MEARAEKAQGKRGRFRRERVFDYKLLLFLVDADGVAALRLISAGGANAMIRGFSPGENIKSTRSSLSARARCPFSPRKEFLCAV